MKAREKRPIREQVKSGFCLAAWLLLTLVFVFFVLESIVLIAGKDSHTHPGSRVIGIFGLLATSTVMFFTVRRWSKWLVGVMGYMILKTAISGLLGFSPSVPSIARPRLVFWEFLAVLVFATVLCARYLTRIPGSIEAVGLVGIVIGISFSVVNDSSLPILGAAALLALIQLTHRKRKAGVSSLAARPPIAG